MDWQQIQTDLRSRDYVASDDLAMALHLSVAINKPLLLEGAAGVGKTQLAKSLAELLDTRLIRLQCYEGLDAAATLYEWNYQRQLLSIRASQDEHSRAEEVEDHIFSERFLLKRPLLQAILEDKPAVLLIDEVDRADEEFEAFLLELLAEWQVTVPELGTIKAVTHPHIVLTSNGTRDLSDALRRRCLYAYVDYPDRQTELAILAARLPGLEKRLAEQIVGVVSALRKEELQKKPGIAEMLDWAAAISGLGINDLADDPASVQASLVCLLKTRADRAAVPIEVQQRLVGKAA